MALLTTLVVVSPSFVMTFSKPFMAFSKTLPSIFVRSESRSVMLLRSPLTVLPMPVRMTLGISATLFIRLLIPFMSSPAIFSGPWRI